MDSIPGRKKNPSGVGHFLSPSGQLRWRTTTPSRSLRLFSATAPSPYLRLQTREDSNSIQTEHATGFITVLFLDHLNLIKTKIFYFCLVLYCYLKKNLLYDVILFSIIALLSIERTRLRTMTIEM